MRDAPAAVFFCYVVIVCMFLYIYGKRHTNVFHFYTLSFEMKERRVSSVIPKIGQMENRPQQ